MSVDRRRILAFVQQRTYSPMRRRELARAMRLAGDEYPEFREALDGLVDEGSIVLGRGRRYTAAAQAGMFSATIEVKGGRYGFVRPREAGAGELFVPPDALGDALDGDTVLVRTEHSRGRRVARVEKVVVRARRLIAGRFVATPGGGIVVPDRRALPEIEISASDAGGATDGQKVAVELVRVPHGSRIPGGRVVELLGAAGTYAAERAACAAEFGLEAEFSSDAEGEAARLPADLGEAERARRTDFTRETVVAIDPDDARDHDDAVHVARSADGSWLLRVHIADVAHYVTAGGAIDREARARGTSVYLPGEVFRMLPDRLSTDLCSLVDGRVRATKTVSMTFAPDGRRTSFEIDRGIVRSSGTLTYGRVRRALEGERIDEITGDILDMLRGARELHELLRARRMKAGSLDFAFPETRVVIDAAGRVAAIERHLSDFSHHIVEEFMLEANRAVADVCVDAGLPALYRIHEDPDERALDDFAKAAAEEGIVLRRPFTREKLQAVVARASAEGAGDDSLAFALLRALKLARYYELCVPHYALAFDRYLHFTSPIRRYPDLVVHRALDAAFEPGSAQIRGRRRGVPGTLDGDRLADLAHLASHCSARERAAERAERELTRFRQLEYLHDHPDAAARGVIRSVDEYGLLIDLEGVWLAARAPLSKLPADTYRFDATRGVLKGKRTRYAAGDRVRTRVVEVDLVAREAVVGVLLE